MKKIVYVTGCLGFIGRYITRKCLQKGWYVLGVDCETYAADTDLLSEFLKYENFKYIKANINDLTYLYDCDYIINTAAETHVDNSIVNNSEFIKSNIDGVHNLLRLIQTKNRFIMPTLVHFSTDEVYGDIDQGSHVETDLCKPSNPYSATKAAADMLITAWGRTHNVPFIVLRPTNNYGIGQYPEKFIPKACKYLRLGKPIPMHENGEPRRTWLHVEDTADATLFIIENGQANNIYNISGNYEDSNLNVLKKILAANDINPNNYSDYSDFSITRAGQDTRYSISDHKLKTLGWEPKRLFDIELEKIVQYNKNNFIW